MPAEVSKAIDDAVLALRNAGYNEVADAVLVEVKDKKGGGGVRKFADNVWAELKKLPDENAEAVMQLVFPYFDKIDRSVRHLNGDVNQRAGNEIMLDEADFGVEKDYAD